MPATGKNVMNKRTTLVFTILFGAIALVALALSSDQLGVGAIVLVAKNRTLLGYSLLGLVAAIVGVSIVKAKPYSLKKRLLLVLLLPIAAYAGTCLYVAVFPTEYGRCDYYTQELNGGTKDFGGQAYTVTLCGTGGDDMQSNDEVRLQVFGEAGELVAQRRFTVNWNDSGFPKALEYHPDHITYYDNNGTDFDKQLAMPPSRLEWLMSRIPLLN